MFHRHYLDIEFDCHCCHPPEAHAVTEAAERGKCRRQGCDCQVYSQNRSSAFHELLDLMDRTCSRDAKRKALLSDDFDLEAWLDRYRNVQWPARTLQNSTSKD